MSNEFYWLAVGLVTVVSSSRLTRLATFDKFPPARWLRDLYGDWTDKHTVTRGWSVLAYCPWCASPWITAGVVLWGWATDFNEVWWLINSIFAAAYLAAILMVHDGDDSEDEPEDETL